ncbi:MAG: glycogen/starch/alpha-glucan phosphorylase [Bavariicoccus seileri]|uniref:glycogen/starch/alpha-glucan phosphorylase n=1 Tax=Bavariicoccus seileri TaxID=549685 RepID=UPI003F9DB69A
MLSEVKTFQKEYMTQFEDLYAYSYEEGTDTEHFLALGLLLRRYYGDRWKESVSEYRQDKKRQVYYFSMEYLPGRQLKSNLLNLGLLQTARTAIDGLGLDFDQIVRAEVDPALGNGGLGRLASCFMDSMASTGIAGNGCGIRYRYGLFKQKFLNGHQIELPENWLRNLNVWEVRREGKAVTVRFGGTVELVPNADNDLKPVYHNTQTILAVPYDTPQIGYHNKTVNTLRLFSAEVPYEDETAYQTPQERNAVKQITEVLYPDDSNYEGRLLRLKQEYFLCSAGIQTIVNHFKGLKLEWSEFPEKVAIHINDTHPTLCIPELMRILLDDEGLSWEQAWNIIHKTFSYTNHTILAEAMERWPVDMVERTLPRIMQIIWEINRRHYLIKGALYGQDIAHKTAPVIDGQVQMAHLAILASHSVNGVAKLHTEILENYTLRNFKLISPAKFNNKTNGITLRRWVMLANEPLSNLIDQRIGKEWRSSPKEVSLLKAYQTDKKLLKELLAVKKANKERFAAYVADQMNIEIDPNALFDVQIKRLHAYKRQLLQALHIIDRYWKIKESPGSIQQPRVFIFGAKAAPSYHYAKEIIKLINALAALVNNDPEVSEFIKVVFVENYGVSLAELIIPSADLSEQISLSGKEASGTSNMKLMANGALTIGTLDGANVEIRDSVGEDNLFLFGLKADEVENLKASHIYHSADYYHNNPRIKRILDTLIDGTIPDIEEEGRDIFDSLVTYNDEYFLLKDFDSFVDAQDQADLAFQDPHEWARKCLLNIAASGNFSSDYTVLRYAKEIWKVDPGSHLFNIQDFS